MTKLSRAIPTWLDRERKAQEEAKRQKAAIEEAVRLKRLEDEARAEAERIR